MWVVDWKKLEMQACRLRSHTVDVTPPQAATKIMAGMAEQQTEWRNRMADGMFEWREWREWRNGRKNGRMAEWQKWLHTYYLWYTPTTTPKTTTTPFNLLYYKIEWRHGRIAEWRNGNIMAEWRNGNRMAEWWNGVMAECRNGGMAEWRNGGMVI